MGAITSKDQPADPQGDETEEGLLLPPDVVYIQHAAIPDMGALRMDNWVHIPLSEFGVDEVDRRYRCGIRDGYANAPFPDMPRGAYAEGYGEGVALRALGAKVRAAALLVAEVERIGRIGAEDLDATD